MAKDAKMREKQLRRIRELEDKSGEATREIERLLGDIKTLTTKQDLDKKALEAKQVPTLRLCRAFVRCALLRWCMPW
jgi:predicted  nucleic acid-binding Zn-ribbon protein